MAYYNKIGLLVLNSDQTKFLVCMKAKSAKDYFYLMPGGKIEKGETDIECLVREIKEELSCKVDLPSLKFIAEYIDVAAGHPDKEVSIKLYSGKLIGSPVPSMEIKEIHWVGKEAVNDPKNSPISTNKIIPDLVKNGILK
ncbi:MAG: NUDIX domain-containing protein [archaeon]|jgi:8-oxo-dGTP pyrophosphatase MutT (NUDIX family)